MLAGLIGTKYQPELERYLGTGSVVGTQTCTLHTTAVPQGTQNGGSTVPDRVISDARQVIASASGVLATLDPAGERYLAIVSAATYLQNLIDGGTATQAEITAAMTSLARALAGDY